MRKKFAPDLNWLIFFFLLFFGQLFTPLAGKADVIVVNYGRYPSAEAAAFDEKNAIWTDADLSDDTVCTASFAAPALERLAGILGLASPEEIAAAPFYGDKSRLLVYLDEKGLEKEVLTPLDWEIRRSHILLNFQKVAGPLPGDEKRIPLELRVLEEEDEEGVVLAWPGEIKTQPVW